MTITNPPHSPCCPPHLYQRRSLPPPAGHHQQQSVQKEAKIQRHLCRTQPQHRSLASSRLSLGSCFVTVDLRQTHLHPAFTDSLSLAHYVINHRFTTTMPLRKTPERLRASFLHASISGVEEVCFVEKMKCLVTRFVFSFYLLFLCTDIPILVLRICYPGLGF